MAETRRRSRSPAHGFDRVVRRLLAAAIPFMVALPGLASLHPSRAIIRIAVVAYAIVVCALIIESVLAAGNRRVGWIMLLIAHAFWFAMPAAVQSVVPDLWFGDWIGISIDEQYIAVALVLIGLFLLCSTLAYWLTSMMSRPPVPTRRSPVPRRNEMLLVALLLLGLFPYLAYAASGGGAGILTMMLMGRADKPWRYETFYAAASTNTIFWICQASLVAAGSLGLLGALFSRGRARRAANMLAAFIAIAIIFLDQGTRSLTAMLVMPAGLVWMFVSPSRVVRKALWAGPLLAFALLAATQLQFYLRTDHDRAQLREKSLVEVLAPRQHNDFFTETALAASIVPAERDYIEESPEWIILTNIVPRSMWEGKPVPQTFWVYSFYRWGRDVFVTGGNALPSVVGQYYMNWGWVGVVWVGTMFGAAFAWLDRLALRTRGDPYLLLVPFTWMVFLFVAFRYLGPGVHYTAVLLSFIWLIARRAPRIAVRRRGVQPVGSYAVALPA